MADPTLDELKLFLAGAADAETRLRVEEALRNPSSRASRLVAFVEKGRRDPLRWSILDLTRIWPWERERFPRHSIEQAEQEIRHRMVGIKRGVEQKTADWPEYYNLMEISFERLPPEHPLHRELEQLYRELHVIGPKSMPSGIFQSYESECGPRDGALGPASDKDDDEYEKA
jgi:hypothetical protein